MLQNKMIQFLKDEMQCSENDIYRLLNADLSKIIARCVDIITEEANLDDENHKSYNPERELLAEQVMCELTKSNAKFMQVAV